MINCLYNKLSFNLQSLKWRNTIFSHYLISHCIDKVSRTNELLLYQAIKGALHFLLTVRYDICIREIFT